MEASRWRARVYGLAALVGVARMFVGAHLPLDVVGGAGLGWAVAAGLRLVIGAPTGPPTLKRVRDGLQRRGFEPGDLTPLVTTADTSAVYRLTDSDQGDLFVKVLSDRPQDRDLLYRWWLRLSRRVPAADQRFASPRLQVEFEATRTMAAAAAGARVPNVVYTGPLDGENAVLITTWVPGHTVDPGQRLAGPAAADARAQVSSLHAARISHGALTADNILVDDDQVTLLDLGSATLLANPGDLAADNETLSRTLGQQNHP